MAKRASRVALLAILPGIIFCTLLGMHARPHSAASGPCLRATLAREHPAAQLSEAATLFDANVQWMAAAYVPGVRVNAGVMYVVYARNGEDMYMLRELTASIDSMLRATDGTANFTVIGLDAQTTRLVGSAMQKRNFTTVIVRELAAPRADDDAAVVKKHGEFRACIARNATFKQSSIVEEDKRCWNSLMTMRVVAYEQTYFDITLALDTDVIVNHQIRDAHGAHALTNLGQVLRRYDFAGVHQGCYAPACSVEKPFGFQGGFLLYASSPATRRFLREWRMLTANSILNEQYTLVLLLNEARDLQVFRPVWLPSWWMCRGGGQEGLDDRQVVAYTATSESPGTPAPCLTFHSHGAAGHYKGQMVF
jgi:hypothetical protein